MMASPSPKSPEQSERSKKYDRQLRLWGDDGQAALELSKVCVINATATGTELLKSLVLPGIGAFTIVDGKKITEEDIGCNFFLDHESCGKSRAQIATQLLLELNPDVRGDFVDESVEQLLENSPDFFNNFTVVIGTSLSERTLILLSKKLWELEIPFIVCRSYGFFGYIRTQFTEHTIVESHPDSRLPDLRLDKPFPELVKYVDSFDLTALEYKDHAGIPYLVILYKYLQQWKEESGKSLPRTPKEKEELRTLIRAGIYRNDEGVPLEEDNFDEAIKAVNSATVSSDIPSQIRNILNDDCCVNLTSKSKPFWIMAKAVYDFVENEGDGLLPLRGSLPDMTADTNHYIALQQVYRNQAAKDTEIVFRRVQQLLHHLNQPSDTITESDVKLFCRHVHDLRLLRGTSVTDEYDLNHPQNMAFMLENQENEIVIYVMLRGIDRFYTEYNMYPGVFDGQVEPDIAKLKACVSRLLNEWGCAPLSKDDYVHELCRYGASELHSVAAFIGGCVAQETIKFITRQYVPINNTFIYDAIHASAATFTF